MRLKFVGDWKVLKHCGFKYTKWKKVTYRFEGLDKEFQYSNTHIDRVGGIVHVDYCTDFLSKVLTHLNSWKGWRDRPEMVYVNLDTQDVSFESKPDYKGIHTFGEGLYELAMMYDHGLIVEDGCQVMYKIKEL
ncbi:hypothetical protein NVP1121O_163 [Vibrio phage 1.121.O._10N.286.46.C4]|nr:hypothetical protein NVP1121O_163 [Vibrio phage 1.121.O._10N.286.46.C4]